jgi:carbamoyl-phosphate synthase large subunit
MKVERVYKVKEGRPNVVDFIKGQRIHLIVNTPTGLEPWFDEKAIRRAAVMARIPTITTLSAARAAAEGHRRPAARRSEHTGATAVARGESELIFFDV